MSVEALTEFYGEPIHVYTAANAVADGTMILATPSTTREAGYNLPVVLTREAWSELIEWTRDEWSQTEDARLWDVLTVARAAAKAAANEPGNRYGSRVLRVPNRTRSGRPAKGHTARSVAFHVTVQAYDTEGTPCLTILLPGED